MILYFALLALGLFQATVLGADVLAELFGNDQRDGTLGLLYLTGLNSFEIFTGQLGAGIVIGLNKIMALTPCLILPFVMRAIPWSGVPATLLTLFAWALLCIGLRIFSAAVFSDSSAAELFALAAVLVVGGGTFLLSGMSWLLTGAPIDGFWVQFSPADALFQLFRNFGAVDARRVLISNLTSLALAAAFIYSAGAILARKSRDLIFKGESGRKAGWTERWRRARRARLRALWLDSAPYAWLAARGTPAFFAPWMSLTALLGLWVAGFCAWKTYWLLPINLWLFALLISLVMHWTIHYSFSHQIAADRANGTLELLLTTLLSPEEIIRGQKQLDARFFRPVRIAVAVSFLIFSIAGALGKTYTPLQFASYIVIWIGVASVGPWFNPEGVWTTFWVCLNVGRPAFALKKYVWQGGGFLNIAFQVLLHIKELKKVPYGSPIELGITAAFSVGLVVVSFVARRPSGRAKLREEILSDFRFVAAQPLPEKDDPRLKAWKIQKTFFERDNWDRREPSRPSETTEG
jgi:hypothetical protein